MARYLRHLKPARASRVVHRIPREIKSRIADEVAKLWPEFEAFFIAECARQMPENLLGMQNILTDSRVIKTRHTKDGYTFQINASTKGGRILIVWELGNVKAVPYRIYPRWKKTLSWLEPTGETYEGGTDKSGRVHRKWVTYTKVIPPHRFIRRAWSISIDKYRNKINDIVVRVLRENL